MRQQGLLSVRLTLVYSDTSIRSLQTAPDPLRTSSVLLMSEERTPLSCNLNQLMARKDLWIIHGLRMLR